MSLSFIIIAAVVLFFVYTMWRGRPDISGLDARRKVEDGARLVDVRSPGEFASGKLPGALNLPVGDLARRVAELEPKSQPIVVYCQSGMRSAAAARELRRAGFADVSNLGAISRW